MIYICIPTHNEQQTVGVVLWKLRQVLTEFPRDYQLLVADDASTDKTPEVLEPYTRVLPLTVVRCERRLGQAASLELLLREALRRSEYPKRDVVVTLQADFSEEPDDLVPMIKRIEAGADVVVGNKVSVTRPPRAKRLARALGNFFSRSQKWPEGVTTPFEGYRAYRLYAVKRAVDDRPGRRLIRYDSWAGHAELLRAVLPHARRVESLDVEDRPDRLQRPRRERPFAAAMQVRPMMRGIEPIGLVGVEELDRMAATASRSRDRSAVLSQRTDLARADGAERSNGRDRSRSRNGGRERERNGQPRQERAGQARPDRPAKAAAQRGEARPAAAPTGNRADGQQRKQRQRPERPARKSQKTENKPVVAEEKSGLIEQPIEQPVTVPIGAEAGAEAPATESRPKRKRRRKRRRSGDAGAQRSAVQTGEQTAAAIEPSDADTPEPEENGEDGERSEGVPGSTRTSEGKRRRRRGGRGRRRRQRPTAAEAGTGAVEVSPTSFEPAPVSVESQPQVEARNEA